MHLNIEYHCHTTASDDSLTTPEQLLVACRRKKIDRVVVTDHNTTAGALRAQDIDPQMVIIGEEVMTTAGELLAAFVTEEIPSGLTPQEAIHRLRDQGAYISVSHPFDRLRKGSWRVEDLVEIAPLVDAVEVFNARCMKPSYNTRAAAFAREYALSGTVGSDAHAAVELGAARMLLPEFGDAESFRIAMQQVEYKVRLSGPWVHFYSMYAHWRKSQSGFSEG
jgi:predicted metal-dependent phosphoesterase TrpH